MKLIEKWQYVNQKVGNIDLAEKSFKKAEEVKKKVLPSEREKYEDKS